jgi:uncharacterized protein YjbI with pentapeptide repeats
MKPPLAPDLPPELQRLDEEPAALRGFEVNERLVAATDWSERDATGLRLRECRLDGMLIDGAELRRGELRDVEIDGGSWANASAVESALRRVCFRNTRLTGTVFANAVFDDVVFEDCRLDLASFRFANLTRVRFERCRLDEADLYEARFESAVFSRCSLANASLAEVTFVDTELRGCDLTAVGNPEQLRGVRMTWADVVEAAGVLAAAVGIQVVD